MNYSINPKELGSFFALPSSIVDEHIKLSSEYQLKALLIFLKNQGDEMVYSLIQKKLSLSESEVKECLDYWVQRGVLFSEEASLVIKQNESTKAIVKEITTPKPTREEAVKRIASSKELGFLTSVVEEKLSRPITAAEIRSLVWFYDSYGLPIPVIIQAIQYAHDSGKLNFSYIEKVCVDWARNDITTLSKAEERLNLLYLSKTAWKIVENTFGIEHRNPSAYEKKCADKWINEYGFTKEMLKAAYDVCVNKTSKLKFSYINSVLEKWHKNGYKTPEDVEQNENQKQNNDKKTSYSKNKLNKKFNNFD